MYVRNPYPPARKVWAAGWTIIDTICFLWLSTVLGVMSIGIAAYLWSVTHG